MRYLLVGFTLLSQSIGYSQYQSWVGADLSFKPIKKTKVELGVQQRMNGINAWNRTFLSGKLNYKVFSGVSFFGGYRFGISPNPQSAIDLKTITYRHRTALGIEINPIDWINDKSRLSFGINGQWQWSQSKFNRDRKVIRTKISVKYDINDFIVLNLNRNQPRKCWDHTIIAWVEFVEMHYNVNVKNTIKKNTNNTRPIKLIIGTQINAYWNLWDVLENEVKFRDVPLNYIKDTIIEVPMPQQLSDKEINILYNSCDVGCNNCNGGGYELTVFECLGLGIPQVASYVGGIREYLNENNSIPIKSTIYQYLDNKSNGIGGKAEITDPHDFALAFWKYFNNPALRIKHGKNGRENILKNYRWETLVRYFHSNILTKI